MKNKLTPDDIAMILTDFDADGELSTCSCFNMECKNCPLGIEEKLTKQSICDLLILVSKRLNEEV